MRELSAEQFTDIIPVDTPLEELAGHQCVISAFSSMRNSMERCQRISEQIMVSKCRNCGYGGILPLCTPHVTQIFSYVKQDVGQTCRSCGSPDTVHTEPVEFPKPKPQVVLPDRFEPVREPEFWEMNW